MGKNNNTENETNTKTQIN